MWPELAFHFVFQFLGELDDTQKHRIEELQSRIRKQDDELFTQRKQLLELSNLVDKQKTELIKRDDKLKEQVFVSQVQEERLYEKGKEIVQMIQTKEFERDADDDEKYQMEKQVISLHPKEGV